MTLPFVYLCVQTIFLWALVIFFHRQKNKITLIPLYVFIALLTLLTHNLSDLGFAIIINQWFLLVSSFSFFTTLMMGILFLYIFEGPRATRLALLVILFTSFFYIGVVGLLGMQVDTSRWVTLSLNRVPYYFWSISAIIIDVFFISIFWEILKKNHKLPLFLRIFLVFFGTYTLDTFIFATGVFGGQTLYQSILQGDLITRFALALVITPIVSYFLSKEGYSEEERDKQKNVWEILNFSSDLESKIQTMEEAIRAQKELESKLKESHEKYQLALEGANAGIWDWDIVSGDIMFSPRFSTLLGYGKNELPDTIDTFKKLIHPDDLASTFASIAESFKTKKTLSLEYRLQNKNGAYKWYLKGGIVKYSADDKPIRMVGSIIDIDEKKQAIESYKEKVKELEKLNSLMVGREILMVEMKTQLKKLQENP